MKNKKNMKKKKAFTLFELMGVIILLGVVALIAVPIVLNSTTKTEKQAYKVSASGILRAIENELANTGYSEIPVIFVIDKETIRKKESISISEIEYNGKLDSNGYVYVNYYENSAMCICNDKYCATKSYQDKDITVFTKTEKNNCGGNLNLDDNLDLDDITETDTVEIDHEFIIYLPNIYDTEGETLNINYEVKNSSGVVIGNQDNMKVIPNDYTKIYNDTLTIDYSVYDETINQTKEKTKIISVVDTVFPTLNPSIESTDSYKSLNTKITLNAYDKTNMKMYISKTGYETGGEWEDYSETKLLTLDGSLDGENRSVYITIMDEAGNKTENTLIYKVYEECSSTKSNTEYRTCSSSCTKTATITYKDNYTSKVCKTENGSSVSCSGGNCSSGSSSGGSSGGSSYQETSCSCPDQCCQKRRSCNSNATTVEGSFVGCSCTSYCYRNLTGRDWGEGCRCSTYCSDDPEC